MNCVENVDLWIAARQREELTDSILSNHRVCSKHFISELDDQKPPSAKTITLRPRSTASAKSNGSAVSPVSTDTCKLAQNDRKSEKSSSSAHSNRAKEQKQKEEDCAVDEEQAATKIQAVFRGHKARQSMKQPAANKNDAKGEAQHEGEPTREQLEEEFRADDQELCNAATKIQASFRGHLTRKHEAEKKHDEGSSASKPGEKNDEIDDIDLSDPELNKAAVKIQASFRGHMVRKEHDEELQHNDATK